MGILVFLVAVLAVILLLWVIVLAFKLHKLSKDFEKRKIPYLGAGLLQTIQFIFGSGNLAQMEIDFYRYVKTLDSPVAATSDFSAKGNLIVTDLDHLKGILVKDFDHFINRRSITTKHANKYVRNMLFAMEDEQWRGIRTKLTPAFTTGRIRKMFQIFQNSSERMESYLKDNISFPMHTTGDIDFMQIISKYTLDCVASVAFGADSKSFEVLPHQMSKFEQMAKRFGFQFTGKAMLKFVIMTATPKLADLLGIDVMDIGAQDYYASVVRHALKKRRESGKRREDFLQLMMDAQQGLLKADEKEESSGDNRTQHSLQNVIFDDSVIIANGMSFLMAGFDTTQSVILLALYFLALDSNVQEKLYEEIRSVLEKNKGNLTYDSITEMPYLDMVINETLRWNPPTTRTERACLKTYNIPGTNVTIKKGEIVTIPIRGIHHDPKYYPEPEKFIPDRFSPENKALRSPYAFIPFGHGPRNCIGMRFAMIKAKTAVVQLVKCFKFAPCAKTQIPLELSNNVALKPKESMWLNITTRQ